MFQIIVLDLFAIGLGVLIASQLEGPLSFCVYLVSAILLATALFIKWLQARKRFWEAIKKWEE